jgi:methylenetetrahydrofolate reductase (NADPH)
VKDYGIDLAIKMVRQLRDKGKTPGFHFCTLNLEKSVRKILEGLKWLGEVPVFTEQNRLITVCSFDFFLSFLLTSS